MSIVGKTDRFCSCHTYTLHLLQDEDPVDGIDQTDWCLSAGRYNEDDKRNLASTYVKVESSPPRNYFWKISRGNYYPKYFNITLGQDEQNKTRSNNDESNIDQTGWILLSDKVNGDPRPLGNERASVRLMQRHDRWANIQWKIKYNDIKQAFTIQLAVDADAVKPINMKNWYLSAVREQKPTDNTINRSKVSTYVILSKIAKNCYWKITAIEDPLVKDLTLKVRKLEENASKRDEEMQGLKDKINRVLQLLEVERARVNLISTDVPSPY